MKNKDNKKKDTPEVTPEMIDDRNHEAMMEEFKILREVIAKNHDSQFITMGFTIASIGAIMGVLVSGDKVKFCDVLYLLNFGMFILLASFIIITRLIYSIKIIGGYINYYLEPALFGEKGGWEKQLSQLLKNNKHNVVLLRHGSHMKFLYFHIFIGFSILLTLLVKFNQFPVYFNTITGINQTLFVLIFLMYIILLALCLELAWKVRTWRDVWKK